MARWRQVDRPDTIPGRSQRVFGDGQRNSRLSDAAGSDNRHEPGD